MFLHDFVSSRCVAWLAFFFLTVPIVSAQEPSWCSTTPLEPSNGTAQSGKHFKILPMGASIVYGLMSSDGNGFRLGLQNLLEANGSEATMVGTQQSGNMSDNHHEAYQGLTIPEFNNKSYHSGAYDMGANVALVLIGTNDCWYTPANDSAGDPRFEAGIAAASRFGSLLGSLRTKASKALVLASELPRNTNDWEDRCIQGFNSHLSVVVQDAAEKGQQVRLVPMYDVVPLDQIGPDGTHPTDYGYQLMAHQWYNAVVNATTDLCVENDVNTTTVGAASNDSSSPQSTSPAKSESSVGALPAYHAMWALVPLAIWALGV